MTKNDFITNAIVSGEANDLKQAEAMWKAHREEQGIATGSYQESLRERLIEGIMDEDELTEWIKKQVEAGFKADKYKNEFNKLRELANKIHNAENGTGTGAAAEFYARLKDDTMGTELFEEWIADQSPNAQKHKKHYDAIRMMANDIHNSYRG